MAGTFTARIAELRRITGMPFDLSGSLVVDQIYAHRQHEELSYRHPRGGQAKFLEQPLFDHYRMYLANYARTVLDDGGRKAMAQNMENLSDQVKFHAPVEFNHLRRSGHPVVTIGGTPVYDREPEVHRLTEEQLKAQSRLLYPFLPDALKGWLYWRYNPRGQAGHPPLGSGWRRRRP
jgi:hypothetical protein